MFIIDGSKYNIHLTCFGSSGLSSTCLNFGSARSDKAPEETDPGVVISVNEYVPHNLGLIGRFVQAVPDAQRLVLRFALRKRTAMGTC